MYRVNQKHLWILLVVAVLANAVLLFDAPQIVQALAVLVLAGLLPGLLGVELLLGWSVAPPPLGELTLYAVALGYGILVAVMLLLSYLPGPLAVWQPTVAFNLLLVVLVALVWWRLRNPPAVEATASPQRSIKQRPSSWLVAGLIVLALTAAFVRLANLGYAEFHGDEARAALRAAAVIQGYDDVLLLHKKGPVEILLPAAIFSTSGHLTEAAARLPFALANWAALFAVLLLGWRIFGPLAGWTAAMLLALDGYFVGFSRFVQYQSIVILTSVLVVLILVRLLYKPRAFTNYLVLAAILLATGMLSHYEAVLVVIPALYLLGVIFYRHRAMSRAIGSAVAIAALIGGAILALFYLPYVLHPQFRATVTYLTERRIGGGGFPYNNLVDFFTRTTLYSSTYYVVFMVLLLVVALIWLYRRNLGPVWGPVLSLLLVSGMIITAWRATWLTIGAVDATVFFFLLALLPAWILPKVRTGERALWLWFGVTMLLALFLVAKPRTHVYVFFTPWALLAGMVLARGWYWMKRRIGARPAEMVGSAATLLLVAIFGVYIYWFFVYTDVEILRTWQKNRPAGYWTAYDVLDNRALFGFPLANGWKAVGMLYASGEIEGDYATNEVEFWAPAWYTRNQLRCADRADWMFEISNPQSDPDGYKRAIDAYLEKEYEPWGVVEINEQPRLLMHRRSQEPFDVRTFLLDDYAAAFDASATPDLPLGYPVVEPSISQPLHANLDNLIWLEGYDLDFDPPLDPGEAFRLTLYWRAQQSIPDSYKVFNQSYYGDGVMVAQQDGYPVCGERGTWLWDPGELIADVHEITVKADAPPGLYPLFTGMYIEETFDRLSVLDEAGNPVADQIHLADIRIGEE